VLHDSTTGRRPAARYISLMTNAAMNARRSVLVLVDYQARLMPAIHRAAQMAAADSNGGRREDDDAPKSLLSPAAR